MLIRSVAGPAGLVQTSAAEGAAMVQTPNGFVAVHVANERYGRAHERATRAEIARRLAAFKGYDFAGAYDRTKTYSGPLYFVPSDTLIGAEAKALGIQGEHDLFGGVVPFSFVATKAITHPLVEPDAAAPVGWSHDLGPRRGDAVLQGFSGFSLEDAQRAGARLLRRGPVRVKRVRETGGLGQIVAADAAALEQALAALDPAEVARDGVVLEENLSKVTTGSAVYGGSDLAVVRGGFDALLNLDPPEGARQAIAQAQAYDAAAETAFPGMILSRRNYDVARGFDAGRRPRCGVLEQSWRMGGASGAEIAALEAFRADPSLRAVRAATVEIYGEAEPPPHATVYFCGRDEEVGPMTKYAVVERYDDAR
jgi:hypothetical protein